MTIKQKQTYVERMAREIGEYFDCVQILAHDSDSESYQTFEAGSGSLFARQYQAMRWSDDRLEDDVPEEEEES